MEFNFELERFSGPYTSLLLMIEERKLSITEVSLASLADDYISYVQSLPDKDYMDISQFVVVAATLMLIKIKSLLPGIAYTENEEKQIHDLENKLKVYESLRKAMKNIERTYGKNPLYAKSRMKLTDPVFTPSQSLTLETLHSIAHLMQAAFERVDRVKKHVMSQVVRLEDVIENLRSRISQVTSMKLSELTNGMVGTFEEKKKTVIVSFLAILELVKSGVMHADQNDEDIILESRNMNQEA